MKTKPIKNVNSNTEDKFVNERKLLAFDASYRWKKYWKIINIYFYIANAIGLGLFITAAIIYPQQNDLNKAKILGMVFGFISLAFLAIAWILNVFFNSPIKYISNSQKYLQQLYTRQKQIMIFYRIIFFSLTTIPTFTLVIGTNIIDRYYTASIATIYASLGVFIGLAIITIWIHIAYIRNKQAMYKLVLQNTI